MKRPGILHIVAIILILSLASCRRTQLPEIETGCWYMTEADGSICFVNFESFSAQKGNAEGIYYSMVSDSSAVKNEFSAQFGRKKTSLTTGGHTESFPRGRFVFSKYTEPEFKVADTSLYRQKFCDVKVTEDISYANVKGYWSSLPGVEADVSRAFSHGYIKSFRHKDLELQMDLYQPQGLEGKRPLIMFMHGGAFYVGDKREPAYIDFCRHFAAMGYVTASINYRMGFHVGKGEIERAGYVALQDAHAAMRFLVSHADEYGIDTKQIFVAGSSAGSITALNLAFMTEEDRPQSSYGANGPFNGNDLGTIDGSGNDIKADFHIKAVANMWGAISKTDIIRNSKTDIISFYGDQDNVVPFAEGYPFASAGQAISQMLSDKMYGSICIDSTARAHGLRSRIYPFPGEGHALNTTGKKKAPNKNHTFIKGKMTGFFFDEIQPVQASIRCLGGGRYEVGAKVASAEWKVEGGFIIASDRKGIQVIWMEDAPLHRVTVSGTYPNGIGYCKSKNI